MPIARFQMPDGRIARFEVPEGTTPEQAQAQFQQWQSSQSAQQAAPAQPDQAPTEQPGMLERLGNLFTGADRETRATQELPELQNSGILAGLDIPATQGAALAAAIGTMTNPEEIAQALQAASPDIGIQYDEKGNIIAANNRTGARAVINKPGVSGLDVAQGTALLAAFAPAGRAATAAGGGIARQAAVLGAGSAATQAAIEGAQAGAGGEFNASDVALSGALGAASPVIAGGIGRAVDAARTGIAAMRGQPAAASPLLQAAEQANVPLMTSDIAQPETFIGQAAQKLGERIPIAGTGGMRATQQEARQQAIRELGSAFPDPDPAAIVNSLKAQTSRIRQAAGQRYDELVPKINAVGEIPYNKTAQTLDDALDALVKPGVMGSDDAVRELQQFRDLLASAPQTYETLQLNRTALREAIDSYDSVSRSQLPSRAKALMNRVYSSLTQDMDDAAKAALSERDFVRLKEAQSIWRDEAQKLTKTRLKSVLDKGELTPEVAETLVFSRKPSEVKALYGSLDSSGRQAMRATIIQRAIKDAGGLDNVSPEKFLTSINKLSSQTGVAFKGQDRAQIEGLKRVLEATRRAGQAGVQTPTGQELYAPVGAAAAGSMLGFGWGLASGAAVGYLARAYESPFVRNALIRIGQAPSSDASKRLALQFAREINGAVQAANAQSSAQ